MSDSPVCRVCHLPRSAGCGCALGFDPECPSVNWKANHDHQVALKRELHSRYDALYRAARDLVTLAEGYHDYILELTGSVDGFVVIERAKKALDG